MKRIIEVNGQKEALIEREDIDTLRVSRYFIPEQLLNEPAILNMECDEDGYYHIMEPAHVEYIASLGFIPDYDYLASLSSEELNALANHALEEKKKVSDIVIKLCTYKEKLKGREKRVLRKSEFLEPRCANWIEDNVLNASLEGAMFREMEEALLAQARNYALAILKMAETPSVHEGQSKAKRF